MKKNNTSFGESFRRFLKLNVPIIYLLIVIILVAGATHFVTRKMVVKELKEEEHSVSGYNVKRLSGYKFIRPLLSAKPAEESARYIDIKNSVARVISEYKDKGIISSASVYMRDFDKSDWMNVFDLERFIPGSILKIPVLMTYLLEEEEKPGTLDTRFVFNKKYDTGITQGIVSGGIEFGKSYSVRQLLEYMIVYSDNNANLILNEHMNISKLVRIFKDLNLKAPAPGAPVDPLTARECSRFMEVLFNATYLNVKNSEYAMNLLTKTQFSEGILKGVPEKNLLIAHKFGESGNNINRQLHETAILYIDGRPYLVTIMTLGKENVPINELAQVIQQVSKTVYEGIEELIGRSR